MHTLREREQNSKLKTPPSPTPSPLAPCLSPSKKYTPQRDRYEVSFYRDISLLK
jgi:hypothetical protein